MQRPRILHLPPSSARADTTAGRDAVELASIAGLNLDPWQQLVLEESLAQRPDGQWSAFEVAQVVPRQNGKNAILEARELFGLFLEPSERLIVHTAHEFDTALEHFGRIRLLIEGCPDLSSKVKSITTSNGKEGIELVDGSRLRFRARTSGGGRGFSGDVVVLDESYELTSAQMRALLHTLSARPNPQLWYASTAVDQTEQPNGLVLAGVRERAVSAAGGRLAYFEWSVDEATFWDDPAKAAADPELWAQANPALGIRIDPEFVAAELDASSDVRSFGVERLGVGDWPATSVEEEHVIDMDVWMDLADVTSTPQDPVAFAVDVSPDRTWSAIGAAGVRADGRRHVEITGRDGTLDHRRGTRWVAGRLVDLVDRHSPCAVLVDGRSPAASLIPELEQAGIQLASGDPTEDAPLVKTNAADMARACGAFFDAADGDELRHLGQQTLDDALDGADTRTLSGAWAWARRDGADISPLVAVTLALHGHMLFAEPSGPTVLEGRLMA